MPKPSPVAASPALEILTDETVWDGHYPVQQIRFRNRRFDGHFSGVRTWELWRRGRAGALLPYDPAEDAVVLVEQFRLPAAAAGVDPVLVELPAGLCDGDETPEATILRETEEEIGLRPRRLHPIGDFLLSPGGCDEHVRIVVGEVTAPAADAGGVAGHAGLAAEEEDIRIRVWPAERAVEAALDGAFPNAVTSIALLWFAARRNVVRRAWGCA